MTAFHSAAVAHHARMIAPDFADGDYSMIYYIHPDAPVIVLQGKAGDRLTPAPRNTYAKRCALAD